MSQKISTLNTPLPDQSSTFRHPTTNSIGTIENYHQTIALSRAGSHPSGSGCGMLGVLSQHPAAIGSRRRRALETTQQDDEGTITSDSPLARRSCNNTPTENAIIQYHLPPEIAREYIRMPVGLRPLGLEYLIPRSSCGQMNVKCTFCGALHFIEEQSNDGHFLNCCNKGKVKLVLPSEDFPQLLKDLFERKHELSENFLQNIRQYNNAHAFASFEFHNSTGIGRDSAGPYSFIIHGQVYYRSFPLLPSNSTYDLKYSQLYVVDIEQALGNRMGVPHNRRCMPNLMLSIDTLLRECNPFAIAFKNMAQIVEEESREARNQGRSIEHYSMVFYQDPTMDQRRYNVVSSDEIAIVFKSKDGLPPSHVNCFAQLKIPQNGSTAVQMKYCNPQCDPMLYPLFFPRGNHGWHIRIPQVTRLDSCASDGERRVTLKMFYCHRLAFRERDFNILLMGGKLTQQYIVCAYVKIEGNNLEFILRHQHQLRVESYNGLADYLAQRAEDTNVRVGRMIVLPSSFIGSPRAMMQLYLDAMALVSSFGKPHIFLTITCNPKWPEITENLLFGQKPEDRPDLISRVFHLKLRQLLDKITKQDYFGKVKAHIGVIEFQKRGLPHSHVILIMDADDSYVTADRVDTLISAEIPNPSMYPRVHNTVMRCMIHGPCGNINPNAACMEKGKCKKGFPYEFTSQTTIIPGHYPRYRRRMFQEINFSDTSGGNEQTTIDNRWVVPHNRRLLAEFDCHINVEVCTSIGIVKYIFKYLYKGHDCVVLKLRSQLLENGQEEQVWDEVTSYVDTRYVSPPEAMWRILGFEMSFRSHTVVRLAVHLPQEQPIYFREESEETAFLAAATKHSTLIAWFTLNQTDPNSHHYFYREIPLHYVFNEKNRTWIPRKRGFNVIGRVYSVSPRDTERFCLRLLLNHVKGATSFEALATVRGVRYHSFKEAAITLGLLPDDSSWEKTMQEAAQHKMPHELRNLLAVIFVFCNPTNPLALYQRFQRDLIEDFLHLGHSDDAAKALSLDSISQILKFHAKTLEHYNLPTPRADILNNSIPQRNHVAMDTVGLQDGLSVGMLNENQRLAYHRVMTAIHSTDVNPRQFFLDGPGGTGKTFLYKAITTALRTSGKTVISVASTGIAATLLVDGRTYHSAFKLIPPITDTTTSLIKPNSPEAQTLRNCSLIIWDEATMTPSHALDAVDKLLRDITEFRNKPFGGKVVLLGGDFRQCLPVVKRGHRVAVVQSSIKTALSWPCFQTLHLTVNMRTLETGEAWFPQWLIILGMAILQMTVVSMKTYSKFHRA